MDWLADNWLELLLALWPLLAFIAAMTPTETDNKVLAQLRKLLDAVAMNFGHAKNAPPKAD